MMGIAPIEDGIAIVVGARIMAAMTRMIVMMRMVTFIGETIGMLDRSRGGQGEVKKMIGTGTMTDIDIHPVALSTKTEMSVSGNALESDRSTNIAGNRIRVSSPVKFPSSHLRLESHCIGTQA